MKLILKVLVFMIKSLIYPLRRLYKDCSDPDTTPKTTADTLILLSSTVIMQSVIVLIIAGLLGVLW